MKLAKHMKSKPLVFLDTSVLFAGIWSPTGGAKLLLRLGEVGLIELIISKTVLAQIEGVFRRKALDLLSQLAVLLHYAHVYISPPSPAELYTQCKQLIPQAGNAQILADAIHSPVDYFVTLDKTLFIRSSSLNDFVLFPIGTPGDCIEWLRNKFSDYGFISSMQ